KKRNAVATVQESTTPEKCDDIVSNQKSDGSFEVNETICKDIDVPVTNVVNEVKECTQNPKLQSPQSEPWWKTGLTLSFLNVAAPHHKNQWEDKSKKAQEYLTKEIKDSDTEKELLDCTDQYLVDNIAKKVEKDHKKAAAIAVIQDEASPDKHKEIVSKQKDDGSIQLDDSVCNDLGVPKENVITTIKNNITNPKLQLPQLPSLLETAVNLSYLKNAAPKYKGDWVDKYNKARDYLSKQIGDSDAEKELLECADNYVVDKATDKVIEDHKKDIIAPKTRAPFVPEIYSDAPTISEEEALCTAQEAASPDKCKDIVSNQKDDGSIELDDTVCDELDVPKEEIIPTIQKNVTHEKLKSSKFPSLFSTAIVLSYLKKIAPKHKDHWKEQHDKAREYISKNVGDADAEKELEECADQYVVDKITEKANKEDEPIVKHYKTTQTLILDKHIEDIISDDKEPDQKDKEAAFVITQERVTPEVCEAITSAADDDGCIELNETVCKELDLPKEEIINTIQKNVTNEKLKSPESSSWLSTAINLSYLKNAASKLGDQWKDKYDKARDYLSKQIGDADAEKELLDLTDNYVVDNCAKKAIKDNKRSGIVHVQTSSTPDKCEDVVSKQKDDGSFELSDTICKELEVPTEEKEIVTTVKSSTPNPKLQSPESDPWWKTALTLSYLNVAAPHHKKQWEDKHDKARDYLSKEIGDPTTEKELLDCTNKYVVDKAHDKAVKNNVHENIYVTKLDFDDDTARAVHEGLRAPVNADTARIVCDSQQEDGSFTLSPLINEHLNINPNDAIKSLKRFVGSPRLRGCDDSVWNTAFTIYYLKNILPDHENVWRDACDRASKWLSKQIDDEKLEKELFSA
ncbi:1674_t:CDS:1, partial [Cetraspora pellucida]